MLENCLDSVSLTKVPLDLFPLHNRKRRSKTMHNSSDDFNGPKAKLTCHETLSINNYDTMEQPFQFVTF